MKFFRNLSILKTLAEKQTGKNLLAICNDNGDEYKSKRYDNFCRENGILHQKTIPYNPQQNGVAERFNRTILERIRCMLIDSALDKSFWTEAANTAVYLMNLIPKKKEKISANEK